MRLKFSTVWIREANEFWKFSMADFFGLNVRGVKGVVWRGKGPHDAPKPLQEQS